MIEIRRNPANRGVTIVTVNSTVYMRRGLPGRYHAVMTGPASAKNLGVIDGERRRPHIRCMTVFADIGRLNMGERFAGGFNAVMAADTVTGDIDMIKVRGQPANCGMTIVASVVTGDMRWVFARCRDAIMTRAAGAHHLRMVDRIGGGPHSAVVAILANICCLYVCQVLARRLDAIVTTGAISANAHVIKIGRSPGITRMAIVASVAACNVGRMLAGGYDAIVTGVAGTDDLRVINGEHRREYVGVVAVFTDITCLNVRLVFACCLHTVVTVDAISGDIQVIEIRRQPSSRRVAVVTSIAADQMIQVFAASDNAIVAGPTISDNLHVIDKVSRRERIGVMAVLTDDSGLNVAWVFAGCICAVVAVRTATENICVAEIRRQPAGSCMAVVTVCTAWNVSRVFANGCDTVMTGAAFAQNLHMVDSKRRRPDIWVVAVFADVGRQNMRRTFARGLDAVVAANTVACYVYVIKVRR